MRSTRARSGSGFTLIEVVIALTILAMVGANVLMVTRSTRQAYDSSSSQSTLDMQLDRTMDRIAFALMAARTVSLTPPNNTPLYTPWVTFDQSMGYEDGVPIVGDTERIELVAGPEQVVWKQRPDTPEERKVVWTNWVRDLFKDEVFNGLDDDLNGLTDEPGLAFTVDGNRVTIRLTLERKGADGAIVRRTQETTVTCRN